MGSGIESERLGARAERKRAKAWYVPRGVGASQQADVVVVGAGPAGLAAAACLQQRGATCVLLERADAVGASWRRHYDRLHLHTHRSFSALPGMGFPPGTPA